VYCICYRRAGGAHRVSVSPCDNLSAYEQLVERNSIVNSRSVAETNSFVKLLFGVLSSGEYDADLKVKRAAAKSSLPVTIEPTVNAVTRVPASDSPAGISLHGDVDMRISRPGAVVQPLVTGNNRTAEDRDYRHDDVYRPGNDARAESQYRKDWKRRSPQRMVR